MSRWHPARRIDDLAACDIVIEAVFEDLAVKAPRRSHTRSPAPATSAS